jgi:hypothetical protein
MQRKVRCVFEVTLNTLRFASMSLSSSLLWLHLFVDPFVVRGVGFVQHLLLLFIGMARCVDALPVACASLVVERSKQLLS